MLLKLRLPFIAKVEKPVLDRFNRRKVDQCSWKCVTTKDVRRNGQVKPVFVSTHKFYATSDLSDWFKSIVSTKSMDY